MNKLIAFLGCLLVYGCVGSAFADGLPPSQLPGLPASVLPKACDCNPCTCDPKDCKCEGCALGCRKSGAQASAAEELAFVGFEATQPVSTLPRAPVAAPVASSGFHTEYRQVCNGTSCQMVAVSVPDQAAQATTYSATPAYGPSTFTYTSSSSCGSQAQGGMNGAFMSRGPLRRVFGRAFRGRCSS